MALKIFKLPDPLDKRVNKNFIVTSAAIQAVKGAAANIFIPDSETEEPVGRSYLGTPVIDRLEFPQGAYTDLDGNTIDYPAVVVDTVIFEVSKPRNIVKTAVQGRDGTVKEHVSDGDFQISCRGMISNRDNVFPLNDVRDLRTIFEVPQQVPVVSLFLNDVFEIFNIVIEDYSIPQVEGKRNEIPFSFTASSDVPLDLEELV
jgi:hypothetical protein